jgi:hypothetical protein
LETLKKERSLALSVFWRKFVCHVWELMKILRRLGEKGLVVEKDTLKLATDIEETVKGEK